MAGIINFISELYAYLMVHGPAIAGILLAIIAVAESIVRLTPTEKDDTAVERIGGWVRKVLDMFGKLFPNKKKGGGEHVKKKDKV